MARTTKNTQPTTTFAALPINALFRLTLDDAAVRKSSKKFATDEYGDKQRIAADTIVFPLGAAETEVEQDALAPVEAKATGAQKPSKKTKKAAKALKASRSRSPEAKAARRLIRSYFFAAMIATSKDQDADTIAYFTAKAERLEAQLDEAFATVAACRVR